MSPKEVLEFAKKNDAKQLDLRFTDIPSLQHHVSYPINEFIAVYENGFVPPVRLCWCPTGNEVEVEHQG